MRSPTSARPLLARLLLFIACTTLAWAPGVAGAVDLYGVFERSLQNPGNYADPFDFAEITLSTQFVAPSGRRVDFIGFHDGDGACGQNGDTWKFRFMPDEVGRWTYTWSWSDGTPGGSGSFDVQDTGIPGPLRIDPDNPTWFKFDRHKGKANQGNVYLSGYYYSEAFYNGASPPRDSATELSVLDSTWHYNLIMTGFWQGAHLERNGWNARPYNGFTPAANGDIETPDTESWCKVDQVLRIMSLRDQIWFNFDGFLRNRAIQAPFPSNVSEERNLVRNWVARLAAYWNVTWNLGFEWQEFGSTALFDRVARDIRAVDPWDHVLSIHSNTDGTTPASWNDWMDMHTTQWNAGEAGTAKQANDSIVRYLDRSAKPVFASEHTWEGETDGKLDPDGIRRGVWGVVTAGGIPLYAEQFFEENRTIDFFDGGAFDYVRIATDFMRGLEFWKMRSHNGVVNGNDTFCLAEAGRTYVVYDQGGGTTTVNLSEASSGTSFDVTWLNPRSGSRIAAGTVNGGASRQLSAPFAGDSVLLLSAAGAGGGDPGDPGDPGGPADPGDPGEPSAGVPPVAPVLLPN